MKLGTFGGLVGLGLISMGLSEMNKEKEFLLDAPAEINTVQASNTKETLTKDTNTSDRVSEIINEAWRKSSHLMPKDYQSYLCGSLTYLEMTDQKDTYKVGQRCTSMAGKNTSQVGEIKLYNTGESVMSQVNILVGHKQNPETGEEEELLASTINNHKL